MLLRLRALLEMIRFSHTLFALPFALLAAAMAWSAERAGQPPLAVALAGSAGHSAVHGYGPQRGDGLQSPGRPAARRAQSATAKRHLPHGHAERGERGAVHRGLCSWASWPARCCSCRAIRCRCWRPCRCWCSCSATATPSDSRCLSHFWLGAALVLAPLGGLGGGAGRDRLAAVLLGVAVMLWVAGFDIIYACQDVDFDRASGCTACRPGWASPGRCIWRPLCHLGMVLLLAALPDVLSRLRSHLPGGLAGHRAACWFTSIGWCGPTT